MSQENQTQGKPPSPDPDKRYFRGQEGRYFGKRLLDGMSYWEEKTSPRFEIEYQELPHPTGPYPYRLDLATVLAKDDMDEIKEQGKLVFHLTGDVGGITYPEHQHAVATAMEQDYIKPPGDPTPKFLYIVGDIVYNFGESKEYYSQFYEPYTTYPGPIFAIPGNHDGMIAPGSSEPSLKAFMDNFCASRPHLTKESVDTGRDTMTQSHCYWTLATPYAILIGLYTNVVEGGELDNNQIAWLHNELAEAKKNDDKALILTMHQPVYSYGSLHGGSEYMYQILENATKETGKRPDLVVAGHEHNYQRFTRTLPNNQQIPYLVAGGGGHWQLRTVNEPPSPDPNVKLIKYVDDKHGYLRLTVSSAAGKATEIRGEYITVPSSQMSWRRGAGVESSQADSFILNLTTHQVTEPSPATAPPPEGE